MYAYVCVLGCCVKHRKHESHCLRDRPSNETYPTLIKRAAFMEGNLVAKLAKDLNYMFGKKKNSNKNQ